MNTTSYYIQAAIARQVLDAMDRGESSIDISVDLNLSSATFNCRPTLKNLWTWYIRRYGA